MNKEYIHVKIKVLRDITTWFIFLNKNLQNTTIISLSLELRVVIVSEKASRGHGWYLTTRFEVQISFWHSNLRFINIFLASVCSPSASIHSGLLLASLCLHNSISGGSNRLWWCFSVVNRNTWWNTRSRNHWLCCWHARIHKLVSKFKFIWQTVLVSSE